MKVVGEALKSPSAPMKASIKAAGTPEGRTVFVTSNLKKFKIEYKMTADAVKNETLQKMTDEVAGYMGNAYTEIVKKTGLKEPTRSVAYGSDGTWPVYLGELRNFYGSASFGTNEITIGNNQGRGDGLGHTCHHEFTHLFQFKTLEDTGNSDEETLPWFGETMADAVAFYTQKKCGTIFSLVDTTSMGDFDIRLDADRYPLGEKNDNDEYLHFPFISYPFGASGMGEKRLRKFSKPGIPTLPERQISA